MRVPLLALLPLAGAAMLGAAEPPAVLSPADATAILQKTSTLRLAPDLSHLTPGERAAVEQLLQVGGIFQRLYEDARHPAAEIERNRLLNEPRAPGGEESDAARLFRLFQGPIATTLDNRRVPFLPVAAETPGKNVYLSGDKHFERTQTDRWLERTAGAGYQLPDHELRQFCDLYYQTELATRAPLPETT